MNNTTNNLTKSFRNIFILGLKYALYFMLIAGIMGFIYGAFGGIWFSPAFVSVSFVGIFVFLNFVLATLCAIINLVFSFFNKGNKSLVRYFAYSLAFLTVFMTYFALYKLLGLEML